MLINGMRVEMNAQDNALLTAALDGKPAPSAVLERYHQLKYRLLRMNYAGPMSREMIAQLCESNGHAEPLEPYEAPKPEPVRDQIDDLDHARVAADPSKVDYTNRSQNNKGEYTGQRAAPQQKFQSKPGDPWTKVEKGRPLTYVSPRDNVRRSGRFQKVKDGKQIIIKSSELRRNFAVPMESAELDDLSPIPATPRPVQI